MKRIFYILIAALVAFTACTKETEIIGLDQPEHDAVYPDGAYVDLQFSVPMPAATKGDMADLPKIDDGSFYVAVFDGSGSLKQYEKAEFDKVTQNGRANAENFKVRLLLRSSESRLHFIANGPAKEEVTGGMESSLIQQWTTDYPEAAYWQRIILPEGITAYSFSAKKKNADGTESAWIDGDQIHFWYLEREVEGKTVYDHVSEGTEGAKHNQYRVNVTSTGRASYNDANTPSHVVNVGDFVDARGFKILDGTGYFQSASVTDAVESVPLVRNFARIKVKAGSGNFTPTSYYLMNIPDKGLIAPYSSEVGGFVPEYSVSRYEKDAQGTPQFVSDDPKIYTLTEGETMNHSTLLKSLTDSKYPANMPASASLIQTVEDVEADPDVIEDWTSYDVGAATATVEQTPSAFIFERGLPNKDQAPTYLLIGGSFEGFEKPRWFKIELTDAVGKYFRIFRDMTYFLEIGQIDGADGYESAAEAAVGTPVSDVSNSLATENLEQVSDGKGTSMWVSYIDYTGTQKADDEGKGEKKAILYKVYDTNSGDALPALIGSTSRYTLEFSGDAIESIITEDSDYSGSDTPDGKDDWRYAVIQLVPTSVSGIVNGELTISGITKDGQTSESGKTLSRKVKYHVMPTQSLKKLEADELNSEKASEETKLTITIPDGLGFSLFPLIFKIEFEQGNMNPVSSKNKDHAGDSIDLPVEYGPSYFSDNNSFYFLFTINYSDYYDRSNKNKPYNGEYNLYFVTTKDYSEKSGSNETWVSVTDRNGYFIYKPTSGSIYSDDNPAVTLVKVKNGE